MNRWRRNVAAVCFVVVGAMSYAFAQGPRGGPQGGMNYDVKTEATIDGTVELVESVTGASGKGRRSMGGTHVVVKAASGERIEVHLGPSAYLAERKLAVAKGDAVTIVGSRVTIEPKCERGDILETVSRSTSVS